MKIRTDFVSNSSSSSFLIASNKDVSSKKVAKDFVDFAINQLPMYSLDKFINERIDDNFFDETLTYEEKVQSITEEFNTEVNLVKDYSTKERLREEMMKLNALFSDDRESSLILPLPFYYSGGSNDSSCDRVYTAKMTLDEIKEMISVCENELISEIEKFDNVVKLSESEFEEEKATAKASGTHHSFLCYPTLKRMIESRQYEVDKVSSFLNKIKKAFNSNKDLYVVQVSYSGDGESFDSIYSIFNLQNFERYNAGKYCFEIIDSENF